MRLATFILTVSLPIAGVACDCGPIPSMEYAIDESDVIVHALVINVTYQKVLDQERAYLDSLGRNEQRVRFGPVQVNEYVLLVVQDYKGALKGDTLTLRTGLDRVTDCGLVLSHGSEIVLYAKSVTIGQAFYDKSMKQEVLTTSSCSRTQSFCRREVKRLMTKMKRSR